MTRLVLIVIVLLASAGISSGPAAANDMKLCSTTGDVAIAACGRLIASRKHSGRNLSIFYSNRGTSYIWKGEYDRGIEEATEAIRIDPKNSFAYGARGWAYTRKNEYDIALSDLSEAIRLNPKVAQDFANRGWAYNQKGDYERALRDLEEAIRINPKLAAAYVNRGWTYTQKGEHDRAIVDLDRGIQLDPKDASAFYTRSAAYNAKGDYDRAIADAGEALRLNPKFAHAYFVRGSAYADKRDPDRAIADFTEALQLDPKFVGAYSNRGFVYNSKGEYDRALVDLNEAIRLDPKAPNPHRHRGTAYLGKGDVDRAMIEFEQAIRLNPKYAEAYASRSLVKEKRGDLDGAYKDAAEAFTLKPGSAEIQKRREQLRTALSVSPPPAVRPTPAPSVAAVPPPQPSPASPAATAATSGPRVALVIGNGNYRHSTRLPNPANDAADMSQTLRKLGFDVVEGRDLDKRGMEDKVREFGRKLDNAGLALFFYAGHGLQVGGKNYLVPVDAKLERAGDLNFDAVDVGNVLAQMEAERRVNLVFLDACRDNPLARSLARSLGTRSTSVGQGLATIQSAIGTMIAYATQPDAVALDGDGRNSPFTTALLKHLSTPGVEIGTLMRRVRADVITATREKQVPWDHSSLIGEVILAR